MCGIVGFLDTECSTKEDVLLATIREMANTLCHRGPDDWGVWADENSGIAFGHRRLSIVDLSPEGHQPMRSASGRFVTVYNGEIYNFPELRRELEPLGHRFRGHSDTEVMLAAIEQWGLERAVRSFIGMFAFALWDRQERLLYLVRDRLGIKPLYYSWLGKAFVFGSELKSLMAHPEFQNDIDRDAVALMMRHNYIPAPYSIFKGICKLLPGTILRVSTESVPSVLDVTSYWSFREVAERGAAKPFEGSEEDAVAALDTLLKQAVKLRMIADVPLGAFLSGGIDSSTVVALMQEQSERPVKTFTIGFHEQAYNEAVWAKAVASHLGTDHTELYVTPEEAMAVIPRLPELYDEPFADSSQIPTFLISWLTRKHVTVSLSGDGGDELFGGYNRYFWGRSIWHKIGWMPQWARGATASLLTSVSPRTWEILFMKLERFMPDKLKQRNPGDKLHKLAEILDVKDPETLYINLISHWKNPSALVIGSREPLTAITDRRTWANLPDFTQKMMYLDTITYLPDDILVKVDRASMGVSLEARVPFLDHRVVEFAWSLPMSMKIRKGQGKWLLRQVLHKYIPKGLIERPKAGFGIPLDAWLRGPLKDWASSLLNEHRLREEGFFNQAMISEKWQEHLSGKRNWQYYLWDILMFEAWLDQNKRNVS